MHRRFVSLALGAAVMVLTVTLAAPAQAAPEDFSCRASAVRLTSPLLNLEPIVANRAGDPCKSDAASLVTLPVPGLLTASVLTATTKSNPDSSNAAASVAGVAITLGGTSIAATALQSGAAAGCLNGKPALAGASYIARLRINGKDYTVGSNPITIPVNPLVTVYINERTTTADTVTARALRVNSPLLKTDLVVAESVADVNRCEQPKPPECSDGGDNGDPEDPLSDALDPGCHTDGNANNPASYDPNDPSETNTNECSDNVDNNNDGNRDFSSPHPDPNCASPDDALESA